MNDSEPVPQLETEGRSKVLWGASLSLVLGLASVPVLKSITGIPAVILGFLTVRRINVQEGRLPGRNVAVAGMALGLLGIALDVYGFVAMLLLKANLASDKLQSQNNLRMMGFAFNSYHDYQQPNHYPRGTLPAPQRLLLFGEEWELTPPDQRLSWMVSILPYLEPPRDLKDRPAQPSYDTVYGRAYRHVHLNEGWQSPGNRTAAETIIRAYVTASHPSYDPTAKPAPTHYVGMAGLGSDAAELPLDARRAGVLGYNRIVTRDDAAAGISTTSLAVETAYKNGPWIAGGYPTVRGVPSNDDDLFGRDRPYGGCFPSSFHLLYLDGHVDEKTYQFSPEIFRSHATLIGDSR